VPPKPASRPAASGPRAKAGPLPVWAWLGLALLAAGVLYLRYRSSKSQPVANADTTATPSTQTGFDSAAQQPSGGAGNAAENLAPVVLGSTSQPDQTTTQVQQTDTTSSAAPTMQAPAAQVATPPPPVYYVNSVPVPVSTGTTAGGAPTGHGPQLG
jgi:hypothetical protein